MIDKTNLTGVRSRREGRSEKFGNLSLESAKLGRAQCLRQVLLQVTFVF